MLIRPLEQLPTKDYTSIRKKMDSDYLANTSIWNLFWREAAINSRLEAGDTSLMGDYNIGTPFNNQSYFFNRVRPLCNNVSGYQRKNRKSTIVVPLENGDQSTADQWTKILLNVYKREGINNTISDAFHQGACISGLNLLHVYIDWREDPISGNIKVDNLAYNSFFIDPYWRKPDLSDCKFVWRRTYLSHSEAAALMPEYWDEIMNLPGNPTGMGRDARFNYTPESYGQTQQNLVAYDEYYYRDYRKQRLLVDKQSGETLDVSFRDNLEIDRFLEENDDVIMMEQMIPTVRLCISIQDKVFYDGPQSIAGLDSFPFIPIIGYYNPMLPYFYTRLQSICTSLRDPQVLLNRRIILSADLLESQLNSGYIFKEGAVIDIKHLFQTGQGRTIPVKDDYSLDDIRPITPPQIPPSFFQLQDTFAQELSYCSGVSEENLGQVVDDNASGFKSALRQGAGLVGLQPIFDRLDYACKLLGELIMNVIRNNYTPGKVKMLLEGKEPAPLFYNKAFGKYHCMVELGFDSESQKQMEFMQYLHLREIGVQIPDRRLIEAAAIQNKEQLLKEMDQQAQQQQQIQQQQMQSQLAVQQAQVKLSEARATADTGLGYERMSRIQENHALAEERKAQALKDDITSLYNFIKAEEELAKMRKEVEGIDYEHAEKLLNLIRSHRDHENGAAQGQGFVQSPEQLNSDQGRQLIGNKDSSM